MRREERAQSLAGMETLLRHARRRILRAEVALRLREGSAWCLKGLLLSAGLFLAFRLLTYALARPVGIRWGYLLALAASFAAVSLGRALVLGLWGRPVPPAHAAERLDLSQATHNRIATAIALLRTGDDSPLARAAIADGIAYLEKLQKEEPQVERPTASWRRMGGYLAASLLLFMAGLYWDAGTLPPRDTQLPAPPAPALAGEHLTGPATPERPAEAKPRQPPPSARDATAPLPTRLDPGDSSRDQRAEPGKESRSEGPAGQQAAGKSRTSQSASSSSSGASGAGVKAEPGTPEPETPKKPRAAKKSTAPQPKADPQNKKGGSINASGSSGAGAMRTTQDEWTSEVKAKASDNDDFDQEREPDEESEEDKQRQGVQPALKNRTSNVSRELSLMMGKGENKEMTKGRGGPNAQKKARGTATMIMGVPVPGFVRGRLLPGPTKSTQEEVEPTPREGAYAAASSLSPARPEETPQESYRPSAALSAHARDYLITYHAEHENKPSGATNP